MPQVTGRTNEHVLREGVFQPGRAEIAREMRCRLMLGDCDEQPRIEPPAEAHRQPVFSG